MPSEEVHITIPLNIAATLEGWLEDEAEKYHIVPENFTSDEHFNEWAEELIEAGLQGNLAPNIDMLTQHAPPLAWILARLYDTLGWPSAANRVRTNKLIDEALLEVLVVPDTEED